MQNVYLHIQLSNYRYNLPIQNTTSTSIYKSKYDVTKFIDIYIEVSCILYMSERLVIDEKMRAIFFINDQFFEHIHLLITVLRLTKCKN